MVYLNVSEELHEYLSHLVFGDVDDGYDFMNCEVVESYEPDVLRKFKDVMTVEFKVFDTLLTLDDLPRLSAAKAKCVKWSSGEEASPDWQPFAWSKVF